MGRSMSSVDGHHISTSKNIHSHMAVDHRDTLNDYQQSLMSGGQSTMGFNFNGGASVMAATSTFTAPSIMTKGNNTNIIKSKIK